MTLENVRKLEKLTIKTYGSRRRIGAPQDTFVVMFNPASFEMNHRNVFNTSQGLNTPGSQTQYSYGGAEELQLDLVLDGSGVAESDLVGFVATRVGDVARRVDRFLSLCFRMDGDIHEPKFLKIQWGDGPLKDFDCRLESVNIHYELFDRNGSPRRAVLKAMFLQDMDAAKRNRKAAKNSPDLSHRRTVREGDTLPGMCQAIYGAVDHYLTVARINGLDDFRCLEPGTEIVFPPLTPEA